MLEVGGDAVLQARDAAVAAAAAAAKAKMPPRLQALFAAAEAAATGARAKEPLTQKGQLDEACKAALQVADRYSMTVEEKTAIAAEAAAAAATWTSGEERGKIARSFALATAIDSELLGWTNQFVYGLSQNSETARPNQS